jgi:hypothetical protein
MQVFDAGPENRTLLWITDLLLDEAADSFRAMIEQASLVIKRTLEAR